MKNKDWFQEQFEELENEPGYIAAGLMIEINEKLFLRMKELGLSQRDLAKAIGKSQPYVSKILNRGTNMTLETLALFAVALEMEVKAPELVPKPRAEVKKVVKKQHLTLIRSLKNEDVRPVKKQPVKTKPSKSSSNTKKKRAV